MRSFRSSIILILIIGFGIGLARSDAWAQAAQPAPAAGPKIDIVITDALAGPEPGRKVERDKSGNLITKPGDLIRYTLTATNRGTEPAHNVEIVDPIPAGTEYVLESATGKEMTISYSIDGGRSYQLPPVTYEVRLPDGKTEKRPAPAGMYTHVKWVVTQPIPPKASVSATLNVRVRTGR
ncbi:MAG: DUF11 domain-containing protein [Candidatus Latescibacteria bacterium]|nr:DUF11 domain-containing protein [Candidatus Latescibacterota bacterium]